MSVERAAQVIRDGGLVAFPTETVYGLGANALDEKAVARIFEAKGRPRTSPLIVHVHSVEMAESLALEWPDPAITLAEHYWPGPLTLVVSKRPEIPDIVTAGLPTVGLRMPDHPLALALIRAAGVPIAAPSANRFTELSPTKAQHIPEALADYVLDGGPARVGIESTVLSVVDWPVLLRPGVIPLPQIAAMIGGPVEVAGSPEEGAHASPGMHPRHYRPRTPLYLLRGGEEPPAGNGARLRIRHEMPRNPARYAARLYEMLHRLDAEQLDWIAVEQPPETPEWAGVIDRLRRMASP
ncbi:MAG TPA: L-threonylcarbamoyladenylate synthase [Bryobacteraceae bacterium]|nr:L-threonylcarbamoyladenylate synthase [Bryobacteraceae bacterium]